ncbi:NAD(P)-dependent alcohol dehydrogenase [Streptomyces rugosispiralis]|uniref:alcohol dehydrogenase (NADP(+)) n=1 Tax=Streptomyces rugosispiralis TaxID=2967341 RepID=A0ABT1UWD5_9ACTN|nr:NAD(P)-dependent alcohol dehydrogenase [Streptomyces rugosispiralis]MCQ8189103.1 NAD(P)-dependent alcohol dehydrogenase [Streptomyces rugosispiralis]
MTVRAYAVERAGGPVRPLDYEPEPLGPLEVDVAVTHCGVCQTDVGLVDDVYGLSRFPLVAGHEAVGVVEAVGSAVDGTRLAVGRRVGVGAMAGACFTCEWCLTGRQYLCPHKDDTALRGDRGAFATRVRASDWRYVQPLPDALAPEHAAPLLCAGITVFSAISRNGVRPTDRVAVVGVGGLGHLALQFLAKWGCHVTAISSTAAKADDARWFGAHEFIVAEEGLQRATGSFDFILSTVSADLPWDAYLAALRPQGTLSVVGVPHEPFSVHPLSLLPGEKRLVGGVVGSAEENRRMLDFATRHGIRPAVETFPVERIGEALDHVRHGRARYRAVLEF